MNQQKEFFNNILNWRKCSLLFIRMYIIFDLLLFSTFCFASNSVTATKDASGTTPATFSITYAQEIEWIANYTGSGNQGNDFYLHTSSTNLVEIELSQSLSSGNNVGTHYLTPGNYSISIDYFGMGPGSYTIIYNRTASIGASPTSYDFGSIDEGLVSSYKTFTISSTGDLPVKITSIVSNDPAHFEITSVPTNQVVPPNRTFQVRYKAGTTAGSFGTNISISGVKESDNTPVPSVTMSVSGQTIPLEPDISCTGGNCGTANYLGQADYTLNEIKTFNYSFQNDGNKSLVITSINLANDSPLNPFSFASSPSTSPLSPGSSRTVSIRFAPSSSGGEATYCGHLIIQTDDPDEPIKMCYFDAKAHHPEPKMVVSPLILDYGEVELGFAFEKKFTVTNNGDATLNISITNSTPANLSQNIVHWSNVTTSMNIAASINGNGGKREFVWTYEPQDISGTGSHTIILQISGNDPTNLTDEVTLTGKGIPPVPIDAVLVLDRSGSMSMTAGSRTKIEALQKAASCFTNLLRQTIPNNATSDRIGLVRYNHNNDVYLSLGYVSDPNHLTTADSKLNNNALQDVSNGLKPDGFTGIGGAMQTAAGMFTLPTLGRKHVMVVMTDGIENRDPRINTVYPGIMQNNPDLRIYSVGLGDVHESAKLQQITNVTNGYHQVSGFLSDAQLYDLEIFYFKIFANATGLQLVVDPTVPVPLTGTAPTIVASAYITSSDRSAVFLVLDEEYLRQFYNLELIDPNGQLILLGTPVGGVPVHRLQKYNYTIYKIVFPDPGLSQLYVGNWDLRLTPNGKYDTTKVKTDLKSHITVATGYINPMQGIVPVGFVAAVSSDYKMQVNAISSNFQPGASIKLLVTLTDRGSPLNEATVKVEITTPIGNQHFLNLSLDGNGVWSGNFVATFEAGSYKFLFKSVGKNNRGEMTTREDSRFVTLTLPEREKPEDSCIPCNLLWLFWIILFILLIIFIIRCCSRKYFIKQ
ncbi:MAG: hypothetical protein DAHOPDDO_00821 [Ignavibacteriaceae bacterium]|nr:hypothetical protein [Ignavibacteriaceae bacterium]